MLLDHALFQNIAPSRIIPPDKNRIRARNVISRSNHGHPYKFPSIKCGRTLHLESGIERDRVTILEFDPSVILFQEQPFKLEYADYDGEIKAKFPDLLVYRDDGSVTVEEIKLQSEVAKPEIKRLFEYEKAAVEQHGYRFEVLTDEEIRSGLLLKNSIMLKPYRRSVVSAVLRASVLAALRECELSSQELINEVYGLTYELVLSLMAQGFISTDLSLPLTNISRYIASKRQSQLSLQQIRALERKCV